MDAARIVFILQNNGKYQDAFNPNTIIEIQKNEESLMKVFMYKQMLTNAIEAKELPAITKPKGKASDKKLLEKLDISIDYIGEFQQYEHWLTLEDLFIFLERPPQIPKEYTHGRDALARVACALIVNKSAFTESALFEFLAHQTETAESTISKNLSLGDNTLKGCCKEIIDCFSTLKDSNTKK